MSSGLSLPCTPNVSFRRASTPKRGYTVTPLYLPSVAPASIPLSINRCGPRINPLHPPGISRRTVSLETLAAHHQNHQRAVVMKQKEYCRYHQNWQRPFYGSRAEKEEYRHELRQILQRQINEKWNLQREAMASRTAESDAVREVDRNELLHDLEQRRNKANFMHSFRDENKKLMELKWKERRIASAWEMLKDREILQYQPINWSGTLK
ncbi:uncharacterized protein LOC122807730 [Protopterus annectens]|uniref:uncharacterized protein LOC122807730 n=1 Tax=Protopterus annectens TaxID=7888 RepID=UPI001CF9AA06|nr:uncharacterized protein LOC122807730 [Protopterus annectens]